MTKTEIMAVLTEKGISFKKSMKVDQLKALLESASTENAVAVVENTVATIEAPETASGEETMITEYVKFLNQNDLPFMEKNGKFIVNCSKKTVFVEIDLEYDVASVYTILNKKITDDPKVNHMNRRNILNLKSLKALRSYTISNSK